MKYVFHLCVFVVAIANSATLAASSITAYDNQTVYETNNHVFHNNEVAQGFVRLNEGFTVMPPHACASLDLLFSVSGGIDLRETSTIRLLKDLECDSSVTLTTGGNIDGRGHTLIFNGNLIIPAGKVLHFNGDTIIDACGHELVIGENAQIFVDTNVTLTITNAIIKNVRNALTSPPLRLGAHTSKLALNNVVFAPVGDVWFQQGQLFVHNDVMITGTSSLVYHSPKPSFIAQNSCLYVDCNVTLSLAPATFTDAPYTLKNTYTDGNFIKMADQTAALCFNGSSLLTTHTGLRLTRGQCLIDGKVACISDTTLTFTGLTARIQDALGSYAFSWSSDGIFFATGFNSGHSTTLDVYHFDGASAALYDSQDYGDIVYAIDWSPDGRYVAVGGFKPTVGYVVKVYQFDGSRLNLIDGAQADYGDTVYAIDWSPDGRYLAVGGDSSKTTHEVKVYLFDGTSLILIQSAQVDYGGAVYSVQWHPDGRYLAISGYAPTNSNEVQVYQFDGATLALVPGAQVDYGLEMDSAVYSVHWSPDGRFLAIGGEEPHHEWPYLGYEIQVYRFDGASLVFSAYAGWGVDTAVQWVEWDPCGKYLAACGVGPRGVNLLRIYDFNGEYLALMHGEGFGSPREVTYPVRWRPDGRYISISKETAPTTYIFKVDYGNEMLPQALSSSIVFGDHAKGRDYDVRINLQPGASLNLDGKMVYDNVDADSVPLPG